jgi:hypothetical protein
VICAVFMVFKWFNNEFLLCPQRYTLVQRRTKHHLMPHHLSILLSLTMHGYFVKSYFHITQVFCYAWLLCEIMEGYGVIQCRNMIVFFHTTHVIQYIYPLHSFSCVLHKLSKLTHRRCRFCEQPKVGSVHGM